MNLLPAPPKAMIPVGNVVFPDLYNKVATRRNFGKTSRETAPPPRFPPKLPRASSTMRNIRPLLPILLAISSAATVRAEEPSAEHLRFFEINVRPVFAEHCIKCHGPEKQWSNFRMDSRAALLAGGDFGEAVIPGKPEDSLLIKAVRQVDEELSMPPKGKLTDRQIADLEEWIRQGAAFPEVEAKSAKAPIATRRIGPSRP